MGSVEEETKKNQYYKINQRHDEDEIVISGISGRYPESENLDEFWENLLSGCELVSADDRRWPVSYLNLPPRQGKVRSVDKMDHDFFHVSGSDANYMDPQVRLLHETTYEAIVDAGVDPDSLKGSQTAVFIGLCYDDTDSAYREDPSKSPAFKQLASSRISYAFDFRGPVFATDTACASSFSAFHKAVATIRANQADQVVVGGVAIHLRPFTAVAFHNLKMLSDDGRSKCMDASADGYCRSEAVVSVFLQKRSVAKRIYATVLNTRTNNDGFKTEGITFPSYERQRLLMMETYSEVGIDPTELSYMEAHMTGTPAGDPVESAAIVAVCCPEEEVEVDDDSNEAGSADASKDDESSKNCSEMQGAEKDATSTDVQTAEGGGAKDGKKGAKKLVKRMKRKEPLLMGCLKSNMGHTEGASGLCAITKACLALQWKELPPNLHLVNANPNIEGLTKGYLKPVLERMPFDGDLIGVNSFGFGGCNVHCVLKANNKVMEPTEKELTFFGLPRLVTACGRTKQAIEYIFNWLEKNPDRITNGFLGLLNDYSKTDPSSGMWIRGYSFMTVTDEIVTSGQPSDGEVKKRTITMSPMKSSRIREKKPLWFVFSALGCQWPGMARSLLPLVPFRESLDASAQIIAPLGYNVKELVLNPETKLMNLIDTFLAIVSVQIALVDLLTFLQLTPDGIVGHSVGEIAAGYADGCMDRRETLLTAYWIAKVATDCQTEGKVPLGGMGAVGMSWESMEERELPEGLFIGCNNAQDSITISGHKDVVKSCLEQLEKEGIFAREVDSCGIPFHCGLVGETYDPIVSKLSQVLTDPKTRSYKWLSTSVPQERWHEPEFRVLGPTYYPNSMVSPVKFGDVFQYIPKDAVVIEVGPHAMLLSLIKRGLGPDATCLALLKRNDSDQNNLETTLGSIGSVYCNGINPRTEKLHPATRYPVGRGTASLSPLIQWDHSKSVDVTKFPEYFNVMKGEQIASFDLMDQSQTFLAGHCIDGRILFPATGYLWIMWQRLAMASGFNSYNDCPVEFFNVKFHRAAMLSKQGTTSFKLIMMPHNGHFSIVEGGAVCVTGRIQVPQVASTKQLEDLIQPKINGALPLSPKEIYKEFRVRGYDYGPTFQGLLEASSDGTRGKIKWTGNWITFTDSMLQLAIIGKKERGLFLPTFIDYLKCDVKALQEAVKIGKDEESGESVLEAKFDKDINAGYTTGIVIKGLRATAAPRRLNQTATIESYGFIPYHESSSRFLTPKQLDFLNRYESWCKMFLSMIRECDSAPGHLELQESVQKKLNELLDKEDQLKRILVESIDEKYNLLKTLHSVLKEGWKQETGEDEEPKREHEGAEEAKREDEEVKKEEETSTSTVSKIELFKQKLASVNVSKDLLLMEPVLNERMIRPHLDVMVENTVSKKVSIIEANESKGIMYDSVCDILEGSQTFNSVNFTYSLLINHTDTSGSGVPTSPLKSNLESASDFLIYKHKSTDFLASQQVTGGKIEGTIAESGKDGQKKEKSSDEISFDEDSFLKSCHAQLKESSFLLLLFRSKVTSIEKEIHEIYCHGDDGNNGNNSGSGRSGLDELPKLESMMKKLESFGFLIVSSKSDESNGFHSILARKPVVPKVEESTEAEESEVEMKKEEKPVVVEVKVGTYEWVNDLKSHLVEPTDESSESGSESKDTGSEKPVAQTVYGLTPGAKEEEEKKTEEEKKKTEGENPESGDAESEKTEKEEEGVALKKKKKKSYKVWLVAKDTPNNGIVGLVNCLRREPGGDRVRCLFVPPSEGEGQFVPPEGQSVPPEGQSVPSSEREGQSVPSSEREGQSVPSSEREGQGNETMNGNILTPELIGKDLVMNVLRNGCFGSFRHLLIPPENLEARAAIKDAYVDVKTKGDLSSLRWFEVDHKYWHGLDKESPFKSPLQVLVHVYYSSINFKDVMVATGRIPMDAYPSADYMGTGLIGMEFSGVNHSGKRCMGYTMSKGIGTSILIEDPHFLWDFPDSWTMAEAATVPVCYLTVYYALIVRGKMREGETVLIHAGSGGVGQAAIHLALSRGCTVFTTVGTQEKRLFLKHTFPSLTDDMIGNSRDCSFEDMIMKQTDGRGVDIVLNSLAEDKFRASVRCLADFGRFLEIGKYDIVQNHPLDLSEFTRNRTFNVVCVAHLDYEAVVIQSPNAIRISHLIRKLVNDGIKSGEVKPLSTHVFEKNQLEEAFRFMATGKHMGKVMIRVRDQYGRDTIPSQDSVTHESESTTKCNGAVLSGIEADEGHNGVPKPVTVEAIKQTFFHPEHAYIITGGLGGFGLELASWMIQKGARKLVISSRNGCKTTFQHNAIKRFREAVTGCGDRKLGENIVIANHDVSTLEGTRALVHEAIKLGPKVGGIFHLAMVLNDALVENQSPELFQSTCLSKVTGTINLDMVTRQLCPDIDYFVCFSSVACGRGNTGQTNYGFANSVMERVCESRRLKNLPGLAIQWGAIGDVGIVAESMGGNDVVIGGTIPQRMPSCFDTLNQVLQFCKDQEPEKGHFSDHFSDHFSVPVTVSSIVKADKKRSGIGGGRGSGDLVRQICHILGVKDHTKLDPGTTLGDLGLDSLMAVEIRQGLERDYDMVLSAQEVRQLRIKDIQAIEATKADEEKKAADKKTPAGSSSAGGTTHPGGSPMSNDTGSGMIASQKGTMEPDDHIIIL